jgi:AcrR family transcriptional regulator
MPRSSPAKRPYLAAAERREGLLDAAAEIVGRRGWGALTMVGLADAAGVSRQLVYEHFAGTSDLMVAVTRHLFERTRAETADVLADAPSVAGEAVRRAYRLVLDLPRAQRRALRSLVDADPALADLRRARRLIRGEILSLWTPYVQKRTGLPERDAWALTWMMISAAWGLADLVEESELTAEQSERMLALVVGGILASTVTPRRQTRGRSRIAPPRGSATDRRSEK